MRVGLLKKGEHEGIRRREVRKRTIRHLRFGGGGGRGGLLDLELLVVGGVVVVVVVGACM